MTLKDQYKPLFDWLYTNVNQRITDRGANVPDPIKYPKGTKTKKQARYVRACVKLNQR